MLQKKQVALIAVALVIAIIGYVYFFIISPIGSKPWLEKPALAPGENVSSRHINWVVNELGGYKLQPSATIELVVDGQKFTVTTKNGRVVSAASSAGDPDLRIVATRDDFAKILAAPDANAQIVSLYNQREISVELLKDQSSLALKGYKGIYDTLNANSVG